MHKRLPLLFLIFTPFLFLSCDGGGASGVTLDQAMTAYSYSSAAYTSGVSDAMDTGSAPGVTYDDSVPGKITITFNSYDISAFASPYTSISGTIVQDTGTFTYTHDVTLTGGPVYSLYIVQGIATFSVFDVNGKSMLNELYPY